MTTPRGGGGTATRIVYPASYIDRQAAEAHGVPPARPLPRRKTVRIKSGSAISEITSNPADTLLIQNTNYIYVGDQSLESADSCCGVFALGPFANITIRNCSFRGFIQGLVVQGFTGMGGMLDISDSEVYETQGQGLYLDTWDHLRLRRTHFIYCGTPTILDHAVYIQSSCGPDMIVTDCAFVDPGSHGIQMRSGGTAQRNFAARCAVGMSLGGGNDPTPGGVVGEFSDNVICEGYDINEVDLRGMGVVVSNVSAAVLENNLLYENLGGGPVSLWLNGDGVILPGIGVHNVSGSNNRVLNWKWGIREDGVVDGYTSTTWGPASALVDTAPVLVLDDLLGSDWIERLRTRKLTAPECIAAVLAVEP